MAGPEPLRDQVIALTKRLNQKAHTIASAGGSYEQYLIDVGSYRELKHHRDELVERLRKIEQEDELPEPDDLDKPKTPEPRVARPRSIGGNPRPWGGSK